MKIYVAAKFERKDMVHAIYAKLRAMGHEISYDWTAHRMIKPYEEHQAEAAGYAENEFEGIAGSDVVILITDERGTTSLLEVGAAAMLHKVTGKPVVYAVGGYNARSPWYFTGHVRRMDTIEEVYADLASMRK